MTSDLEKHIGRAHFMGETLVATVTELISRGKDEHSEMIVRRVMDLARAIERQSELILVELEKAQ